MQPSTKQISKALDEMSDALHILQGVDPTKITKELVDASALLNARLNAFDTLNDKIKGAIKAYLIEGKETIRQGNSYEAVLSVVDKTTLDSKRIKEFLGSKLPKFTITKLENHLSFRPKT